MTEIILIIIGIIALGYLTAILYIRPHWFAYLLVLAIPLDTLIVFRLSEASVSIADVIIIVTIAILAIQVATGRFELQSKIRKLRIYLILAFWIMIILIVSALIQSQYLFAFTQVITRIESVAVLILLPILIDDEEKLTRVLVLWSIAAIISSTVGIYQGFNSTPTNLGDTSIVGRQLGGVTLPFRRSVGLFTIYSYYGSFVLPILSVSLVGLLFKRLLKIPGALWLISFVVILAAIIVTQSRSTWLASVIAILLALWFVLFIRTRKSFAVYALLALGVAVFTLAFLFPQAVPVTALVQDLVNMRRSSVDFRVGQYSFAWSTFISNPLMGVGPGGFLAIDASRTGRVNMLHNMYLTALVEQGIWGGISLLLLLFLPTLAAVKQVASTLLQSRYRYLLAALVAGVVGIYIENSFASGLSYLSVWYSLGYLLATVLVVTAAE